MEAAAIYQAGNYYYAPHQMLFLKVVTDHGTTQEAQSAGSGEHFSQIMDRAAEEVLTFIRQLLPMHESADPADDFVSFTLRSKRSIREANHVRMVPGI